MEIRIYKKDGKRLNVRIKIASFNFDADILIDRQSPKVHFGWSENDVGKKAYIIINRIIHF